MIRLLLVSTITLASTAILSAENYPQFRGGDSSATSSRTLPVVWADDEDQSNNIRWKVDLAGEGWSQPIVWEDRLILTAAVPADPEDASLAGPEPHRSGYGRDRDDLANITYHYRVICLDCDTGREVWQTTVRTGKPRIPRHSTNTYATETPVTDGKRIYASFGMAGVHCLDMSGDQLWQKDFGVFPTRGDWGTASSPTLWDGKLFVQFDNDEKAFLIAFDTESGDERWRIDRDESTQYSSPVIWKNSLRTELIVGGVFYRSHDPDTGEELWRLDMDKGRSSATPVALGDRLYVGTELRNRGGADDGGGRLYAVKPGGRGDITPPRDGMTGPFIQWRMDDSDIQMASPIVCGDNLYFFQRRGGIVSCVDVGSGRLEYKNRVQGARAFWASPWTDGKHIFALDSEGSTHILDKGDNYNVIRVNDLDEQSWATPAIADGRIYLRTVDHLYCID